MGAQTINHDARGSILAGGAIMVAFFAGLGGWATVAPLSSAVIAPAVIKVEGNRKLVQHLEGGIVRELRVKDGDRVEAGQVLLLLDDTQARGAVELLSTQQAELRAQEARLLSEQSAARAIAFPASLEARRPEPEIARVLDAQARYFNSRREAMLGQVRVMRQRIVQTREQIVGAEGQLGAQRQQRDSIRGELIGLQDLFKRGYVPRQRILELERGAAAFDGEATETAALVVKLRQSIEELNLQIDQLQIDRMAQVAADLRDVQVRLIDIAPRLQVAQETLRRTSITAPATGSVVGLTVFTVGGVVAAGETVMEIVPDHGDLRVEATINVEDQKDIRVGSEAEVHLIAYGQRSAPIVSGRVLDVSADRLTDQRTGAGYYVARIKLDQQELRRMTDIHLSPGMPALVVIPTGERTALDYLLRPLTDSFVRALREK